MSVVYPSREWLEELQKRVNSDETYKKVAANWEGDYLCIVEIDGEALRDFQKPKILAGQFSMILMVPKEKRIKFRGTPMEKFFEKLGLKIDENIEFSKLNFEELAKKVANIKLEDVRGAATHIWMDFWHGQLRNIEVVAPGEHEDAKFKLSGPYSAFKEMVIGKVDPTTLIMRGKLKLKGDLAYMMRNAAAVNRYSQIQASIPIEKI
ncbi:MAG: SCP2 sterol-binding domain-containing protein [Archaeoglobaceae archaeon]